MNSVQIAFLAFGFALPLMSAPALAQSAPFAGLAGTWSGSGTILL